MRRKIFVKECLLSLGFTVLCFVIGLLIPISQGEPLNGAFFFKWGVALALVLALSVLVSHFSAGRITAEVARQINDLGKNLDAVDKGKIDAEFVPFVDALVSYKQQLARVDKLKKQFTANVSHELKTPMTSISGYAEMLENGIVKADDVQKIGHVIHKEAKRLINISNDIIQLSQLEDGDETRHYERVDLYDIASDCVSSIAFHAEKKGSEILFEGEHVYINGNKGLLAELVYNLVDNAVRYNKPDGKVWVSVHAQNGKAVLRVKDNGIGIPEKYQERIFERFFRVDKSRSKETGGTGLGLAIVKHIVLYHNAEISIDSELGKGTTFTTVFDMLENPS